MTNFLYARSTRFSDPCKRVCLALLLATLLGTGVYAATGGTSAELEQRLIEQGWQATPDAAGNRLLYPPKQAQSVTAEPPPIVAQATTANPPDLHELLRQRGWVIRESAAGTTLQLLIDPPATAPVAAQDAPPPASRAQDVYRMLEERGWRVRQDAAGNTLLIPAQGAAAASGTTTVEGPAEDPMADFRRAAEATGWRVESTADGSLIMYPPRPSAVQQGAAPIGTTPAHGGCAGKATSSIADGSMRLPVGDEASARQLAREWLVENRPAGQAVGRVRRVNRIFVVSIVDNAPPFPLRNQLVIRSDDGRVIPIN